jgi:hypothetical protein
LVIAAGGALDEFLVTIHKDTGRRARLTRQSRHAHDQQFSHHGLSGTAGKKVAVAPEKIFGRAEFSGPIISEVAPEKVRQFDEQSPVKLLAQFF